MEATISIQDFSQIIKEKRIERKLKSIDMARYLGISKYRYSRIENGLCEPTFLELQKMVCHLDISLDSLFKEKKPILEHKLYD